jgi:SAM-dependent methyltransferase
MSFYSQFAACYEQVFPFREEVYGFLLNHAGSAGSSVLDVGCGPGHYCGRFVHDGYRATGIDLDEAMINEARLNYSEAKFLRLDMRSANSAGNGFRCIYSIGNVLAHLRREDLFSFLETVHAMLVPGGCWIMQVMNWDALPASADYSFPEKTITSPGGVAVFRRSYTSIGPESLKFSFSLQNASSEKLFDEQLDLYPVTCKDYLLLHDAAGFRNLAAYSDFSLSPVRPVPGSGLVMVFMKG